MAPRETGESRVARIRRKNAQTVLRRVKMISLLAFIVLQIATGARNLSVSASDTQAIARVTQQTGEAFVARANGARQRLRTGDSVYQNDVIETARDAAIRLRFADETTFSLGDDALLTLDETVYNPASQMGRVFVAAVKGVFVFASGKLSLASSGRKTVNSPIATIGIRG